ncbi:hypothetical protein TIFTF001_032554 [Ficus carica]|uniref:Uncharacterized protein n=1 Tax=Ficus carica TaxID=3494 RepID=A0AA88DWY7_FICCA|nr:hypothetical protein TIFTF001_032554 [Ficus carica]
MRLDQTTEVGLIAVPSQVTGLTYLHLHWVADPRISSPLKITVGLQGIGLGDTPSTTTKPSLGWLAHAALATPSCIG